MAALIATVTAAVARAGTPGSDPANGSWLGGIVFAGPEHLVLWNLPGTSGAHGTCIDAGTNGPLHGPYAVQSTVTDPVYGELNHLYAKSSTSDVRLAQLSALNSHKYDRVNRATQWSYVLAGAGGMSVADANAMLAAATRRAGPYTVQVTTNASAAVAGHTYTAQVTVRSARGYAVSGLRVAMSGTGVTFAHTTLTTDASGRARVAFTVKQTAGDRFSISAAVTAWTRVAIYTAPGEQHMLAAGTPTTQRGSAGGGVLHLRSVQLIKVAKDDVSQTPVAGYTFRITDSDGRVVVDKITTGQSASDAPLGALRIGRTYTATELSVPASAQLYMPDDPTTTFTVPEGSQPLVVVARDPAMPQPAIVTRAEPAGGGSIGDRITDHVVISGNDGENGVIDATLYGPVSPPQSGKCADLSLAAYLAAPAVEVSAQVDGGSVNQGNGEVVVEGPVVTRAGCYGWAERLTLSPSGATADSPPTAPDESVLVTSPTVPVPPTPPASIPPVSAPPPSPTTTMRTPPLARTGEPVRPRVVLATGLDLIAVGSMLMALAARRRRTD